MKAKHTPGPWAFKKVCVWAPTVPTDGIPVFEFCFTGGIEWLKQAKINARLIAAAPELLAACQEALTINGVDGDSQLKQILQNAVTKATGEKL